MKLIIALLTVTSSAHAAESVVIKQLLLEKSRAVVTSSGALTRGQELVATFGSGKQCLLKVTAARGNVANVDTSACSQATELTVGQKLEASLAIEEVIETNEAPAPTVMPKAKIAPPPKKLKWYPEEAEPTDYSVTDLQYLPKKGKFAVGGSYGHQQVSTSVKSKSGSQNLYTSDIKISSLTTTLGYGISDQLVFGLNAEYVPSATNDLKYGPASTSNDTAVNAKASGLSDLVPLLAFRAIEQGASAATVDLYFSYSPKSGNKVEPTATNRGNNKRGGDLTTLSVQLGQKFSQFSYAAMAGVRHHGTSTSEDADTKEKTSYNSYTNSFVEVAGQIKVSDQVFLQGGLGVDTYSEQKYKEDSSTTETIIKPYGQVTVGLEAKMVIVPKVFALSLAVARAFETDAEVKVGTTDFAATQSGTKVAIGFVAEF